MTLVCWNKFKTRGREMKVVDKGKIRLRRDLLWKVISQKENQQIFGVDLFLLNVNSMNNS